MDNLPVFLGSASTEQEPTATPSVTHTSLFQSALPMWIILITSPTSILPRNMMMIIAVCCDPKIQFADVGCGFGGLLVELSTIFPDTLMIGMELRDKVTEYVKERILALRASTPGQYENISVVRTNSMKYLVNYFEKGQLLKMFFLFPDPHFKEKNHRRRVISLQLLDEYAYALAVGGIIYTITDVEELGDWMRSCLEDHPLFEPVPKDEVDADPVVKLLSCATEEGKKVARNEGQTFQAVFRRIPSED